MAFLTAILLLLIHLPGFSQSSKTGLIDKQATKETRALFYNLKKLLKKHILFGHQHATEYGHGWFDEEDKSDVKLVTGSHPAVIGVDFQGLSGGSEAEIEQAKNRLRKTIVETYNRGGITTVSWHFINPVTPERY